MRIYKYCYNNEVSYYFTNDNIQYIYFYKFHNKKWSRAWYSTNLPFKAIEIDIYELLFNNKKLLYIFFFDKNIKEDDLHLKTYFVFRRIKKELEMIYKGE